MSLYEDVMVLEEGTEDQEAGHCAMQRVINDGSGWAMQGSMGRAMMAAIEDGRCLLGKERRRDYWGNVIPARGDVQDGTKGSPKYVEKAMGAEHLQMLEAL